MRGSDAARACTVRSTSVWAASLASTSTNCQLGDVWPCTLSRNCCRNCGGVLYSGVKMLIAGQFLAFCPASARWVSSVCLAGR